MGKGKLTTHVLDTATGLPAAGLKIELFKVDGEQLTLLKQAATNSDGRVDEPFLQGEEFMAGVYQFHFHAGDYLRDQKVELPDPPFLDLVPLQFGIADAGLHYHVPLLLSPFGYSTYRGS